MPPRKPEKVKAAVMTEYVVLQLVELRPGTDFSEIAEVEASQYPAMQRGLWLPICASDGQPKVFAAPGKQAAIRQHTGDGAEVLVGSWKAVPVSSWKGGETTVRITASDRRSIDEEFARA